MEQARSECRCSDGATAMTRTREDEDDRGGGEERSGPMQVRLTSRSPSPRLRIPRTPLQEANEKKAASEEKYDYEWDTNKKAAYRQKGPAKRRSPPEYGVPMKGQQPDDELAVKWPDGAVWKVPGYTVREHQDNASTKKGGSNSSGDLHQVDTDQGPVTVTKYSRPPAKAGADRQEFVAVWIKKEGDKRPTMVGQVTVKPHFEKLEEFMIKIANNFAGDFSQEKFELAKQEYLKSYGGYGGPRKAAKKKPGAAEPAGPAEDDAVRKRPAARAPMRKPSAHEPECSPEGGDEDHEEEEEEERAAEDQDEGVDEGPGEDEDDDGDGNCQSSSQSQSEETVAAAAAAMRDKKKAGPRKATKKDDPEQERPPNKDKKTKTGGNPEKKDPKKRMHSPEKRSPRSAKRSAARHHVSDSDLSVGEGFGD